MQIDQKINQIKSKILNIMASGSLLEISKYCRMVCSQLTYFIQLSAVQELLFNRKNLLQCFRMLKTILGSLSIDVQTSTLSLLKCVINKFQQLVGEKVNFLSQERKNRIARNQQSQYFNYLENSRVSTHDLCSLKSERINNYLIEQISCGVILQSPQCICCSQVFYKNFPVKNINPLIPVIIQFNNEPFFDKVKFQKYLSAVCNFGGGVILIGVEKKDQNLQVKGINFQDETKINQRHQQIIKSTNNIRPSCLCLVERILVHSNKFEQESCSQQFLRICFRILVFPKQTRQLTYLQFIKKGCMNIYQSYYLNNDLEITKHTPSLIYESIHNLHKQKRKIINNHENIQCFRPYLFYSKQFYENYQKGFIEMDNLQKNSQKIPSNNYFQGQLKFKYKYSCIIVVGSIKNDRYVLALQERIKQAKLLSELVKPYESCFPTKGGRSIWLLSHQFPYLELKKLLAANEEDGYIKQGVIRMMPVENVLQIEREKFNQFNQDIIERKFQDKYGVGLSISTHKITDEKGITKQMVYLRFHGYSQAIYTFLLFEDLQLRAHFCKAKNLQKIVNQQ